MAESIHYGKSGNLWWNLWRKSANCDGNCDGKQSVTISLVTILIVTGLSQFVIENCDGRHSVTIICHGNLWRKKVRHNNFVTEIVTDWLELWRTLWRKLWRKCPSQFCKWSKKKVIPLGKLWRNIPSPSQFVTESTKSVTNSGGLRLQISVTMANCDGILWRIAATISFCDGFPSQFLKF